MSVDFGYTRTVEIKINQYQLRNLCWLLQLASSGAYAIPREYLTNDQIQIGECLNNGDWNGELRWLLEPLVDESDPTNQKLPDWAHLKGRLVSQKYLNKKDEQII